MRYRVFISYSLRGDGLSVEALSRIKRYLEATGIIQAYVDILDNEYGDAYQQRVIDELKSSCLVLAICSQAASRSQWVQLEMRIAQRRGIPVLRVSEQLVSNLLPAQFLARKVTALLTSKTDGICRRRTVDPAGMVGQPPSLVHL